MLPSPPAAAFCFIFIPVNPHESCPPSGHILPHILLIPAAADVAQVSPGGHIYVDDYDYGSFAGCRLAVSSGC
eukprot:scaffold20601_cov146-Isochrysis_galbana.AAC.1